MGVNNWGYPYFLKLVFAAGVFLSLFFHKRLSTSTTYPHLLLCSILFIVPTLLTQRVVPYARVWLFLYPIYLGAIAVGLIGTLDMLIKAFKTNGEAGGLIRVIFSFFLVFFLYLTIFKHSLSGFQFPEDSSTYFHDGKKVAMFIANHFIQPKTKILAIQPANSVLRYYIFLYKLPEPDFISVKDRETFLQEINDCERTILIKRKGESFAKYQSLFHKFGEDLSSYSFKLIKIFPRSEAYELRRLNRK